MKIEREVYSSNSYTRLGKIVLYEHKGAPLAIFPFSAWIINSISGDPAKTAREALSSLIKLIIKEMKDGEERDRLIAESVALYCSL